MEEVSLAEAPTHSWICSQILHPLLTVAMAACMLSLVGWTGVVTEWQHWITCVAGVAFAIQRWLVFKNSSVKGRERSRLIPQIGIGSALFAIAIVLLGLDIAANPSRSGFWHLAIQLGILGCGLASMIHHQTRFTAKAFHPGLLLTGSFFAIIVIGTLLLKMPRCVVPGQTCSWLDAAFTSTSAVCVTGLAVQNTATFFSTTGQVVIMVLIQIGGLGIMTLTFFAAVVLLEGLSLHDRLLLCRMIQERRISRISHTLFFIVGMTFLCESIGAAILFITLDGEMTLVQRLFHSVFHSISAFCNAGFSTFPDGLASADLRDNRIWQTVIMCLIVIGGIGSLVAEDITSWVRAAFQRILGRTKQRTRLRTHSRLALLSTGILIFGGAAVIVISEFVLWDGPANGGMILTGLFHSVTARTAGFNSVPMSDIGPVTIQILMILMFIGGSPGGTAGGIRTTAAALALGHLWSLIRSSRRNLVVFNRSITPEQGTQALGLIVLAILWLCLNFIIFRQLEDHQSISDSRLLFELISAFGTVGLSIDLTPSLSDGGKYLLILNMFVGRIGLLTVLTTLIRPDLRPCSGKPSDSILLN